MVAFLIIGTVVISLTLFFVIILRKLTQVNFNTQSSVQEVYQDLCEVKEKIYGLKSQNKLSAIDCFDILNEIENIKDILDSRG